MYLRIEGDNVKSCLNYCIRFDNEGQSQFDFNAAIPMPSVLNDIPPGTDLDRGLIILGYGGRLVKEYLNYEWIQSAGVTDVEGLRQFLRQSCPEAEEVGKRGVAALEQTGFTNWYDWRIATWGTKWNADGTTVEQIDSQTATISFVTAWSPPTNIVLTLSEKFPELKFSMEYDEPGVDFRGTYECVGGGEIVNECEEWYGDNDTEEADEEELSVTVAS